MIPPVRIVYPAPLETREVRDIFMPFITRFADSLRKFNPGCEYELAVIENGGEEDCIKDCRAQFYDLPVKFYRYEGTGCDIGSFLWFADQQAENVFQVNCVTRVYAWKAGWLQRLVQNREIIGPSLFGTSASREGGKQHICCRCYAADSDDFSKYPHAIKSRDRGVFFEVGDGCLTEWFLSEEKYVGLVYWDGVCDMPTCSPESDFRFQTAKNIFRRGDQSNMLVWDKHSDYYRDADESEKARLARMCFEGP
jgi:hypothetical protein